MIPHYPQSCTLSLELRPLLHPLFAKLPHGVSEFTFANLYLFRDHHAYKLTRIDNDLVAVLGYDDNEPFFMLPFGLPAQPLLDELFRHHHAMKCVHEQEKNRLEELGYFVHEDRDNFDYLYSRHALATLQGRKFHKKRNLIKAFINNFNYEGRPLLDDYLDDALRILEEWRSAHGPGADYAPAKEGLEKSHELQLCGGIYYVDNRPVAYTLGEEIACGTSFVIHFEKAAAGYKGLFQFINQSFADILPNIYHTINREQDLGNAGLRQAKESYKPIGFVKKYKALAG